MLQPFQSLCFTPKAACYQMTVVKVMVLSLGMKPRLAKLKMSLLDRETLLRAKRDVFLVPDEDLFIWPSLLDG